MGFARAQHRDAGGIFRNRLEGEAVNLGETLLPVVGVLDDVENFRRVVFIKNEGARAARMEGEFLARILLNGARADHGARSVSELVDEGREGLVERKADRIGVDDLRLRNVVVERIAAKGVRFIRHAVEVRLHGVGLEFRAVVEFDAFFKRDGVYETVVAHLVAFSEDIVELHVLVEAEKAFIHGLRGAVGKRVARIVGVHRREGGGNGNGHFLRSSGLGGKTGEHAREGKRHGGMSKFHF